MVSGADPLNPTSRTAQPADDEYKPERTPRLALARTSDWSELEEAAKVAIESTALAAERAGASVEEIELHPRFQELNAAQATIQWVESAAALAPELASSPSLLSSALREALIDDGRIPMARYRAAKLVAAELAPAVVGLLDRFDVVLTPSASGSPPPGLEFTGDPLFCRAWTLLGAPAVSVPVTHAPNGLPVALALVGALFRDGRTLASAAWLLNLAGG